MREHVAHKIKICPSATEAATRLLPDIKTEVEALINNRTSILGVFTKAAEELGKVNQKLSEKVTAVHDIQLALTQETVQMEAEMEKNKAVIENITALFNK